MTPVQNPDTASHGAGRVVVDGKFFRLDGRRFRVHGVAYGTFVGPEPDTGFLGPAETARDLAMVARLGANVVRIYRIPPGWFLDLALEHGLRVWLDVPWSKHACFLDSAASQAEARRLVRSAAVALARHPAHFALSVANEVPVDVVRWSGVRRVERFLATLVDEVRHVEPGCLCTFGNFPTTEFLRVPETDFQSWNVYLDDVRDLERYLQRLQLRAGTQPLVIGELGFDTLRHGEAVQAVRLREQLECVARAGAAGAVVFGFTDEWGCAGERIEDWAFGLTRRDRSPKPAFESVRSVFTAPVPAGLPGPGETDWPAVSVVVASYNAASTLVACLQSLERLRYPDYEVCVVDDGSTDGTATLVKQFPRVRWIRHAANRGLSAARNSGIQAARGELVAFTDADCRVDEDWLGHLVGCMRRGGFGGAGGPNLLPPEDAWVAAVVMASPGGPSHVMETDEIAEHVPGCNMVFRREALLEIGGFDPVYRAAGDDVDICWRLQRRGHRIGFAPAGFVWHHRRASVGAYLAQQRGYGHAEALLMHRHPERFDAAGRALWHGRIYAEPAAGAAIGRDMIYGGRHGLAPYQFLYAANPWHPMQGLVSLEYHFLILAPLTGFALWHPPMGKALLLAVLGPVLVSAWAAARVRLPRAQRGRWSKPLAAALFWLQPLVRGWARYRGRFLAQPGPLDQLASLETLAACFASAEGSPANGSAASGRWSPQPGLRQEVALWDASGIGRVEVLEAVREVMRKRQIECRCDSGWEPFDFEVGGDFLVRATLHVVVELHGPRSHHIRVRIAPAWTPMAKGTLLVALCWLGAGVLALQQAGMTALVWGVPLVAAAGAVKWLRVRQRALACMLGVLIHDTLAARVGRGRRTAAPAA